MSENRFGFEWKDEKGQVLGVSLVERNQVGDNTGYVNRFSSPEGIKEAIASYSKGRLKRLQYFYERTSGGRSLLDRSWLEERDDGWWLTREKLGDCWEGRLHDSCDLWVWAWGLVFPYFELAQEKPTAEWKRPFYDLDRKWLGWSDGRGRSPCNLRLRSMTPHVPDPGATLTVEWKERVPTRVDYPSAGWTLYPSSKECPPISGVEVETPRFSIPLGDIRNPVGKEAKLRFRSADGVELVGKLETPTVSTQLPAVVLLHGSGAETGDGGCGHEGRDYTRDERPLFLDIARHLAAAGVATFRYDKRGVGESGGNWEEVSREDLVGDSIAAAEMVAERTGRDVVLAGFSEGGGLAMSAALRTQRVCGVILAGSPARSIDQVVLAKIRHRWSTVGQFSDAVVKEWEDIFRHIRSIDERREGQKIPTRIHGYSFNWWAQHLKHSPIRDAAKLRIPALLLHGRADADVLPEECSAVAAEMARCGVSYEVELFEGLNHFFSRAYPEWPGFEYDIPRGVDERVVRQMVDWLGRFDSAGIQR